jgi:hypothetical protein
MRVLLVTIVLSSVGGTVCAQPANGTVTALDPCFQLARAAAAICYDPTNGAVERLDCQKTRAALGECFAHAAKSTETRAGTGSSEVPSGIFPLELPPSTISPDTYTRTVAPNSPYGADPSKKPSPTVLPDKPTGTVAPKLPTAAGLVGARSANDSMTGLESCFQAARIADAICSKLPNDPAPRLECFQKTRTAQLECLEHVLSETPAGPATQKAPSETIRPEPPTTATLPDGPSKRVSPEQLSQTGSSEKYDSPPKAIVRTNPPELPAPPEMPTVIRPKTADAPVRPTGTNWVVSETTSPVDYSPLVTALIRSTSPVKDAPTTLSILCRGKHTELLVRTDGTWATTRGNELRIDYQINDQPAVRLPWTAFADRKTASYKGDAVGLLQSLPEGARLKINVFDSPGPGHDATFQLTGLDTIRKKIAVACQWAQTANKTSTGNVKLRSSKSSPWRRDQ